MPHRAIRPALVAAVLALAVAACGATSPAQRPSGTASAAPTTPRTEMPTTPAPTTVPGGNGRTPIPSPGTFETAWGEAWDAVPPGFPLPPNAEPAEPGDPADGPVSGAFVVGLAPDQVVNVMQADLVAAGYSTEALSGPLEDGSVVIDSAGRDPACRVQTRVRGLSGVTMITILYGAACPSG
jgi:hypothetical protein